MKLKYWATLCMSVRYISDKSVRELERAAEGLDRAAKRFKYIKEENSADVVISLEDKDRELEGLIDYSCF